MTARLEGGLKRGGRNRGRGSERRGRGCCGCKLGIVSNREEHYTHAHIYLTHKEDSGGKEKARELGGGESAS